MKNITPWESHAIGVAIMTLIFMALIFWVLSHEFKIVRLESQMKSLFEGNTK